MLPPTGTILEIASGTGQHGIFLPLGYNPENGYPAKIIPN
nr:MULTISPECIES: DUF938 domain-containing protein [Planktothricoides]